MRIVDFKLKQNSSREKTIIDEKNDTSVIFIYSKKNSTGKTTLLRAILYTLGFDMPDTEHVKFRDYDFNMKLFVGEKEIRIHRCDKTININGITYELPHDEHTVMAVLFGITNEDLLNNLLGAIYIDQDNGWTTSDQETVTKSYRFSYKNFIRGLDDRDYSDIHRLESEIQNISAEINRYKLVKGIIENQEVNEQPIGQYPESKSLDNDLEKEIMAKRQRMSMVNNDLKSINDVIRKNKQFVDYIEQKKIYVNIPGGTVQVTRENLSDLPMITDSDEARRFNLIIEKNSLEKEIAALEARFKTQTEIENLPSTESQINNVLAGLEPIGATNVKGIIDDLKKKKRMLKKNLKEVEKGIYNPWSKKAEEIKMKYYEELDITVDDCAHDNTNRKSGSDLYKKVFIDKLVRIKLLSEETGYPVPIFCDSPSGREVEPSTVESILNIMQRDFSEHQLFLVSIIDYTKIFEGADIISMNGTLFDQDDLFNSSSKNIDE